jgi:hypothetical protein
MFHAMEFYWKTKNITILSMKDTWAKHKETMDHLRRLEAKFNVLCRVVFSISFKVTNCGEEYDKEYVEVIGFEESLGTNNNPIILEDDTGKDFKGKAKLFDEGPANLV